VEEVYTVGVMDGAAWEMFGSVMGVAFNEDGSLFILDNDAGHVVVVGPSGQFVRTISNKGEGPGELNQPLGLTVLDDGRTAVNDTGRGIKVFNRDGESLQEAGFTFETGMPGAEMHAMPDHSLLSAGLAGRSLTALMRGEEEEEPEGRPIGRFRLDGTQEEFHLAWAGPPVEDAETQTGNMRIVMSRMEAFPLPLSFGVLRDGRVALADSVGYRVKILDASGQVTGTLERPISPVAVTDEIRDSERERRLADPAQAERRDGDAELRTRDGAVEIVLRPADDAGQTIAAIGQFVDAGASRTDERELRRDEEGVRRYEREDRAEPQSESEVHSAVRLADGVAPDLSGGGGSFRLRYLVTSPVVLVSRFLLRLPGRASVRDRRGTVPLADGAQDRQLTRRQFRISLSEVLDRIVEPLLPLLFFRVEHATAADVAEQLIAGPVT